MEPKMIMNHISVSTHMFSVRIAYVMSEVFVMLLIAMVLQIPATAALETLVVLERTQKWKRFFVHYTTTHDKA